MQIAINKKDNTVDVPVIVNDYCNHAGAETEPVEFAKQAWYADAGRYANDDSELLNLLVCQKCESYQDDDGIWQELYA